MELIINPPLIQTIKRLCPQQGLLCINLENAYCYLKLEDDFLIDLFPRLKETIKDPIKLPDYFSHGDIGAHISVIYPEEINTPEKKASIQKNTFELKHTFQILELIKMPLPHKTYYVLSVLAPSLTAIRTEFGLSPLLNFRELWVPFHITLAVE